MDNQQRCFWILVQKIFCPFLHGTNFFQFWCEWNFFRIYLFRNETFSNSCPNLKDIVLLTSGQTLFPLLGLAQVAKSGYFFILVNGTKKSFFQVPSCWNFFFVPSYQHHPVSQGWEGKEIFQFDVGFTKWYRWFNRHRRICSKDYMTNNLIAYMLKDFKKRFTIQ